MEHDARTRKARLLLALYAACTLAIMGFIFFMSAQEGEESSSMSDAIAQWLLSLFVPGFGSWAPAAQEQLYSTLTLLVRKAAHMFEYAVLAVCSMLTVRQAALVRQMNDAQRAGEDAGACSAMGKHALAAFCIASAYAATDEFHQLFVAGRSALATDVLIDACGAALGALALAALLWQRQRKQSTEAAGTD